MEKTILKLQKGQLVSVVTMCPTEKVDKELYKKLNGAPNPFMGRISKRTEFCNIRICDYENLSQVQEERAEGKEPREPWYKWINFPYIAEGKKNGNRYLVVKPMPNLSCKATYYLDGVEVNYRDISHAFKAKSREDVSRVLTLQLDYITRIKQGEITYTK